MGILFPRWLLLLAIVLISHAVEVQAASDRVFRAGAALVDITPPLGASLNGPISKPGPVKGVHDPLHARALVLSDGRLKLALIVLDLTMIERAVCEQAKSSIAQATDLQAQNILIAATHTHAAPRVRAGRAGEVDDQYYDSLVKRITEAAVRANAQLAPARIAFGSFDKPEYLKCRRFLCEPNTVGPNPFGETGERVKSVAGQGGKVIRPAGPVDPQVAIVSLQHADGTPLAVLANYSVHYCGGYAPGMVSADYFGYFAQHLERQLDAGTDHPPVVGIMTNGTSGNTSSISSGGNRYPPFQWMEISGRQLAEQTLEIISQLDHRSDITLAMAQRDLELPVRKPDAQRVEWARRMLNSPKSDLPHRWTKIYAEQTLLLSEYAPTRPVQLQAIRIGPVAIAAVACEVFAETGLAIKSSSPFQATFTISLANGAEGYLPPPEQHALGGYETWPATSSCLEVQAEPKIRDAVHELLQTVHSPL